MVKIVETAPSEPELPPAEATNPPCEKDDSKKPLQPNKDNEIDTPPSDIDSESESDEEDGD